MAKNILYFVAALAILLLVGGVIYFSIQQRQKESAQPQEIVPVQEESGLGSELYQNPAAKVPDANPLEGYQNPFE